MTSERRRATRAVYFTEARLEGLGAGRGDVRMSDLSAGGAFVDSREVLPPGVVSLLRFALRGKDVSVVAEVRYSMPGIGMGLSFLDLRDEDRTLIEQFIRGDEPPGAA